MFAKLMIPVLVLNSFFAPRSQENVKPGNEDPAQILRHNVTVTANRLPTPTRETGTSITVITREDLDRAETVTVIDALQAVMGLSTVNNGNRGSAASVFIRGGNSEHTLVMLDGVELNDPINPARSCDLAHLTLDNVERIEVLRGPQSLLYGSDALGGVINIISRKGQGRPRLSLEAAAGSYGTWTGSAGISGSRGRFHFSLGSSYFQNRGYSAASTLYAGNVENDGYANWSLNGRIGYRSEKNLEIDLAVHRVRSRTEIDNFGGDFGDDPNHVQRYGSTLFKAQVRSLGLGNRWEQALSLSWIDSRRDDENPEDLQHPFDSESGRYDSSSWKLDWQNNFYIHRSNTLMLGLEVQREMGESEFVSSSSWGRTESYFPSRSLISAGFYVQDQVRLADRFFVSSGIRVDRNEGYGAAFTYRLSPVFIVPRTETKLRASLGTGFKAPSLYQLYAPPTSWGPIGNPELKPERSRSWEIGVQQNLGSGDFMVEATYFDSAFSNLVQFDYLTGYVNIGQAVSRGIELAFHSRWFDNLTSNLSYGWTDAREKPSGLPLLRRPRHKWSAVLDGRIGDRITLQLRAVRTGSRPDLDFSTWPSRRVDLPGYTLIDVSATLIVQDSFRLFIRLENLLDIRYEPVLGYGSPGFSLHAGIKFDD